MLSFLADPFTPTHPARRRALRPVRSTTPDNALRLVRAAACMVHRSAVQGRVDGNSEALVRVGASGTHSGEQYTVPTTVQYALLSRDFISHSAGQRGPSREEVLYS